MTTEFKIGDVVRAKGEDGPATFRISLTPEVVATRHDIGVVQGRELRSPFYSVLWMRTGTITGGWAADVMDLVAAGGDDDS